MGCEPTPWKRLARCRPGLEPGPILRGICCCRRSLTPAFSSMGRGVWVPGQARDDEDAAPRSRGLICPSFARNFPPSSDQRAQGMPDARCTRGLVCKAVREKRTRAYRFSGGNPAFPAQWFYGLCRALPGDEFVFVTVIGGLKVDRSPVGLEKPPPT